MALFGGSHLPLDYLYHYTRASSLVPILESGVLRLNALAKMNDPRETQRWQPSLVMDSDALGEDFDFLGMLPEFDVGIRAHIRIASLNVDRYPSSGIDQFDRGYARARMWAQYAGAHTGACLIFKKSALLAEFTSSFGSLPFFAAERVRYMDEPVGDRDGLLEVMASEVAELGPRKAAAQIGRRALLPLYFTKNTDWSSEDEFRLLVESEADFEQVAVRGSIAGVVLGDLFAETDVPEVARLLAAGYELSPALAQLRWMNGLPVALPTFLG